MRSMWSAVRVGVIAGLVASVSLLLGGCASTADSSGSASSGADLIDEPASLRAELVIVAMDEERFRGTPDARWLQSFLSGESRDVGIARSETDDLLGEAKRRLRGAPGYQFMRTPSVVVEPGSRATVSEQAGAGSEMRITVRPRRVESGLYEMSPSIVMLHNQASGDGVIAGVTYRAPLLQYGTVPLTVPLGESRAVRMRKEIGAPIRPEKLQFFVFARLTPAL